MTVHSFLLSNFHVQCCPRIQPIQPIADLIYFLTLPDYQPLMNSVISHLLENIKIEPHKNTGAVHVYYWGQWHITYLTIRGTASSVSCGCVTDGRIPDHEGTACHQWRVHRGTGWITVGCTVNIWKDCWATALAISYLYESVIFTNCNKFGFPLHFFSLWQCEVQKKFPKSLTWRIQIKQKQEWNFLATLNWMKKEITFLARKWLTGYWITPCGWCSCLCVFVCASACMHFTSVFPLVSEGVFKIFPSHVYLVFFLFFLFSYPSHCEVYLYLWVISKSFTLNSSLC